jgi:hypothetical protein
MGEDIGRPGRGALSEGVAGSARPRTSWDREAVAELRGAVYRGDGQAVVDALRERGLEDVLQMAGDGLLVALSKGVSEVREPAARCAALLRERSDSGDEELADQLEAALGFRPAPMLRPLAVDLEELSSMLEGDPLRGGGRIDLESGETWPSGTEEVSGEEFGDEEDLDDAGSERWLWVECLGSRDGYRDMEDFIGTVSDPRRRETLEVAIAARGACGRFQDVLAGWPGELERWHLFSGERSRGRARAWLVGEGHRPTIRWHP